MLYARSPGGAAATAERVARWRPQVEAAARSAGVEPDLLEGLVFLESAGREDAMAGGIEAAAGLTQILAETAQNLLGMEVDVERSARLTRRIDRAFRRGRLTAVQELRRKRRAIDERFDPVKALAGSARYLTIAREELGREDLAFVSYHMGIGNLQDVLRAYGAEPAVLRAALLRLDADAPCRRAEPAGRVRRRLVELPVEALRGARDHAPAPRATRRSWPGWSSCRRRRTRPRRCCTRPSPRRASALPRCCAPPGTTARSQRSRTTPCAPGWRATRAWASSRRGSARCPALYRGLRPEALAMALYIGAQTREYAGGEGPLTVTSTVRDEEYQRRLVRGNGEATRNYSLHTTGWAFDIARVYRSKRQALAFQFVLDRLQVLNVIAWVREPGAIHVTAADDAKALLPLLERLEDG